MREAGLLHRPLFLPSSALFLHPGACSGVGARAPQTKLQACCFPPTSRPLPFRMVAGASPQPTISPLSLALTTVLHSALPVIFLFLEPRSLAGSRLLLSSPLSISALLPDFRSMPWSLSQQSLLAVLLCFLNYSCTEQRWRPCLNRL